MECGVDFGTTYSTVCFEAKEEGGCVPIAGSVFVPTVVFLTYDKSSYYIGRRAVSEFQRRNDGDLFINLKRWVGCYRANMPEFVRKIRPEYSVRPIGDYGMEIAGVRSGSSFYIPVIDLIVLFLRGLILETERYTGRNATGFVCSVPADYNSFKRSFLAVALKDVGKPLRALINEPTAAALANLVLLKMMDDNVGVFDFGGGTFDVSFLHSVGNYFSVLYSIGDNNLGGRDVDSAFTDFIVDKFRLRENRNVFPTVVQNLKEELSSSEKTDVYVVRLGNGEYKMTLSPSDLERVATPFIDKAVELFTKGLEFLDWPDLAVILTGGSSALPGLKERLERVRGVKIVHRHEHVFRVSVAIGSKIYSDMLIEGSQFALLDTCTHSLSDELTGFVPKVMFEKGCPIPNTKSTTYDLEGATMNYGVFEGENPRTWLNEMTFKGVDRRPSAAKGFDKATFTLSVDGRLSVDINGRRLVNVMVPPSSESSTSSAKYLDGTERDVAEFTALYSKCLSSLGIATISPEEIIAGSESFASLGINDKFKFL